MSEFLGIDIKTLDDGGFKFFQTGLIRKVLESTGVDHFHGFPTPTKVEATIGTEANSYEAKRYWPNSYGSVIGIMLYMTSNRIPYIYFVVHHCERFTHNTKASNETAVKRICWHLQGTKDNGIVFNTSKKLVVDCYADAHFAGLWEHTNPQQSICARSRTGYVVNFANCSLLWVSKLQTWIAFSTLNDEYVALYHSLRALLSLKILIKEVIDNLGIDSEKLKFVSRSTVYEENNGAIVVATIPIMTSTSNHIYVKYHWFRQQVGMEFLIRKIESKNQKADIFTKYLQGENF